MEKGKLELAKDRRIFAIAYCSIALIVFLSIMLYPRLFKNDYPKAVGTVKQLYSDKKHALNELRAMFNEIEMTFPNKAVSVVLRTKSNYCELYVDSLSENGDLIELNYYYDKWPIDKPHGLVNKMRFTGINAIRNRGEAVYFRIEEDILWSNTGYFVYSKSHVEGAYIDSNWYAEFVEDN